MKPGRIAGAAARPGRRRKTAAVSGPGVGKGALGRFVYPFFMFHMLAFGLVGFFGAYAHDGPGLGFVYAHGGIAIAVYMAFYLVLFGLDQVKWMLINAGLGMLGIYAQIGWILARFGRRIDDYAWYVHVVPFLYYILYTFLLRQFLLDVTGSRNDARRRAWVESGYVLVSLLLYATLLWRTGAGR
ncbi:hypothetical protein QFW77_07555 [Luteimonas sp. RD2P54]|uniref:Uncharacterized protein n=1 Tax=Luteimonas endophytica TaxID=3042023 RepID=A0ABT6J7Q9_9GAMM|nr:hypothetical protein [Luteimonas endophytica]MDH5822849.1 hypothetical protein [Luteimonas endophytica]